MGMGPLAIYLRQLGYSVSGSDDALTDDIRALLERDGVELSAVPADCELVVFSSAIAKNHPAYVAAFARGLPLVRRGEMLAEVLRDKKLVAICGSHGKTTTTAMLITALRSVHFPAGYVLGGLFADGSPVARVGSNEWVVAEVDESDGTIDRFSPEITVAVNLDWDHPDFYRQVGDFEAAFAALFARTRGDVLISDACPMSARTTAGRTTPARTFGRSGDFQAEISGGAREHTELRLGGRFEIPAATMRARGEFNAANAAAALAAVQLMGVKLRPGMLQDFPGVRRRQTVLFDRNDITVLEDYAHHPAEIRALLASLRRRVGAGGRIVAVFQPHRFSRTAQFKSEFAAALAVADSVHLLDVYAAGEAPVAGGTTADIYAELKKNAPAIPVSYLPGDEAGFGRALSHDVRAANLVAFIGAGDIDRKARDWITLLEAELDRVRWWDERFADLQAKMHAPTRLKREESLANKTTLRVGGAARIYAEPASMEDLRALLTAARAGGIETFMLGRGSNLIVPDEGVEGIVISLAHECWAVFEPRSDGRIWVGAGLRLKNLCGLAAKAGLVGFEFLEGIPGNVGGALRMNAGAMGGWMFDVVDEVELVTLGGEVKTLAKAAMHIEYRHCAELHHAVATGALLVPRRKVDEPAPGSTEEIGRQIDVYRKKRHETQPREPSAGCIFKNPPGDSAGRLIDQCGLKGERVGDAEVSPVHANFIVNRGRASSAEVLELVRRVRARVRQLKGVELQPEVLLYGQRWEDVL
jgi:UDP-N-acetylmuramate--L-alanine ligase/UDP-N-acetylenolpyruvoylglucosamine reductase